MDAAVREFLPDWYERALIDAGVAAVGDARAQHGRDAGGGRAAPLHGRGPYPASSATGGASRQEAREAEPAEEAIDAEVERLRESLAATCRAAGRRGRLHPHRLHRRTAEGEEFDGAQATDRMIELGLEGFSDGLLGASPGDERKIEATMPAEGAPEDIAGAEVAFEVKVKEVREKIRRR